MIYFLRGIEIIYDLNSQFSNCHLLAFDLLICPSLNLSNSCNIKLAGLESAGVESLEIT